MSINFDAPLFRYALPVLAGVLLLALLLFAVVPALQRYQRWRRRAQRWKTKPTGRPRSFARNFVPSRWMKNHASSRKARRASNK